jgi:transposase-like protein
MRFPRTLLEFNEVFPDEAACWRALRRARWPHGFRCPRCGHRRSWQLVKRRLEQCCRCRYQASVTAGTVLHRTQVPLRVWFLGIFFVARHKRGISALQFQKDTGLGSYQTAWSLLHKLRAALAREDSRELVGLVEVDEAYVGATREQGLRGGREVGHKTIVAAAVEERDHGAGALRLRVLEGITFQRDLGPFIQETIDAQRAVVVTDGLNTYRSLPPAGYHHERRIEGDRRRAKEVLPQIHVVFTNLKAWIRGTFHGVSKKYMPRYLDEFEFRFNRRGDEYGLLEAILTHAARSEPWPYARLTAEAIG